MLIDADGLDIVAQNIRTHFAGQLGKEIAQADLAEWLVCAALDGGVEQNPKGEVHAIFLHTKQKKVLEQFLPGKLAELDGMAFRDDVMGEFQLSVVVEEELAGDDFLAQCAHSLLNTDGVNRLILVSEECPKLEIPENKDLVQLSMVPGEGVSSHVSVGFSLLHAFGISAEDLK